MDATFGNKGPVEPEDPPVENDLPESNDENANPNKQEPPKTPPEMVNSLTLSYI